MFKTLLLKEIQLNIKNLRFQVAFVLILLVYITGTFFNMKETREKQEMYNKYYSQWLDGVRKQADANASNLATRWREYLLSPRNNSFISDCKERFMPNVFSYNAFNVYRFDVKQTSINPLLNRFEEINWSFIIVVVISLLSLLLTFDAITGEREASTLALCFTNPVSRAYVLFSKWLSVILVLMITLFVGVIISLIIQILSNVLVFDSSVALEVLLFLFFSFLLIALMTCIGILCSVLSTSSNVSLLYALTLWLFFSLVIPNTSVLWADKLFGIEPSDIIAKTADAKRQDIDRSYPEGRWSSDSRNPFMPEHKLRANMQMDFVLSDKKIYDAYFQDMFAQYEKSRAITNISPISLFECSMEGITYGGFLRFRQNWEALHIYQQQFLSFFKQVDAKDKDSPHWYNPWEDYSTTKKPVKFEEVPLYKEIKPSFSSRFPHIAFYGGLLIIYTFLVFVITFQRFVKSDVR